MCDKPATTTEHVPPKCFFPEKKDMPNTNFRDNPITVPSCDAHNSRTSKDDEYLLVCIASHWRNNQIAYEHTMTKIRRAIEKRKGLGYLLFGNGGHLLINRGGEQGVTIPLNKARFDSEMEKIARGIYFYQFKQNSPKSLIIHSRSLIAILKEWHPIMSDLARIDEISRGLLSVEKKHGANPDIFYYQFLQSSEPTESRRSSGILVPASRKSTIIRLVFYGGFEVTAMFQELALAVA